MITGLLGICITGDLFNLFVMLEVAALSGYALIAMGTNGALYASFRYLLIGTLGACFYLLGVGYLYLVINDNYYSRLTTIKTPVSFTP